MTGAVLLALAIRRYWVPDFLQAAMALMFVVAVYVGANQVQHECGLWAVTVMGIALANQRHANVVAILEFKENLRVFLISAVFILLSARLRLSELGAVGYRTAGFVLILIALIRPLSVWVSTVGSSLARRERWLIGGLAPRGIVAAAVTSVFAIELEQAGHAQARLLVPVMFSTIIGTVLFYSLTGAWAARALGLSDPDPQGFLLVGAGGFCRSLAAALKAAGTRVLLVDTNRANVTAAQLAGLPAYYGSIVSEDVTDELDLSGIGRLLAITANDEVNVLAVRHFSRLFTRENVYQVASASEVRGKLTVDPRWQGRRLFRAEATFARLEDEWEHGSSVKATKLSSVFDYKAFRAQYGEAATVLAVIREDHRVLPTTMDGKLDPRPGQTLLSLVAPTVNGDALALPASTNSFAAPGEDPAA